jgi:hypothetical protein
VFKRLETLLRSERGLAEIVVALVVFILLLMLAGHRVVVQ